jgi:general secretion pathway protein A
MYESFYGLEQHPFSLTPDADFLFLNENFQKSLDKLTYAINRGEAFSVLIGDVGTGKTTLCWALLLRMPKIVRTALILNPLLDVDDLLRAIIQDFNIKPSRRRAPWRVQPAPEAGQLQDASWLDGLSRKQLIDKLNRFLLEGAQNNVSSVLIIDEAQNLSPECLEQLRVLSNLETSKRKLLLIVFSGQIELDKNLNLPQLRQLKQRISARCSLEPLSKKDMIRYIHHRLWKAGSDRSLSFTKSAFSTIYEHSRGYPRLINIICDRALLEGYKKRSLNITKRIVKTALGNLALSEKKESFRPFPFPVRLAGIAIVCLMMLTAITYSIWTPNNDTGSASYQNTVQAVSDEAETDVTEIIPEPQPAQKQAQDPVISPAPPLPSHEFSLQAHSLNTHRNAERAVAGLRRKGYPAYQRMITNRDGTQWHVVYLGPFEDLETANDIAETILERERLRTILRTYSSSGNL